MLKIFVKKKIKMLNVNHALHAYQFPRRVRRLYARGRGYDSKKKKFRFELLGPQIFKVQIYYYAEYNHSAIHITYFWTLIAFFSNNSRKLFQRKFIDTTNSNNETVELSTKLTTKKWYWHSYARVFLPLPSAHSWESNKLHE